MDFSKIRINCNRLPRIFSRNQLCITDKELKRIDDLHLKEQVKGELTEIEYERLEELEEKERHSSLHTVGAGARSYLLFLYEFHKYGKPLKISGNGVQEPTAVNGILKETAVIDLLEDTSGISIHRSKVRFKNDYLNGIPDAFDNEDWKKSKLVHEIKTTSNRLKFMTKKLYPVTVHDFLQIQGYMALTDKKQGVIHHSLVDYPESVISEQKRRMFNYFCPDGYETARFLEEWRKKEDQLRFADMKPSDRIFSCFIDRDDKVIERIYKKVQVCRDWLTAYNELDKEVESSRTCSIQRNSFLALRRRLGLE